jgi:hypothetical protein
LQKRYLKMMDLRALITQWLTDKHPDIKVDRGIVCLAIQSEYIPKSYDGDVWYVCRIEEDRIHLFNPAKMKWGPELLAGLPTFFEQLDEIIGYYRTYSP